MKNTYYYNIYLSSTKFNWWNFFDRNWKSNLIDRIISNPDMIENSINLNFIDPLKIESDSADIVKYDLDCIKRSDFLVCYLPKKITLGTSMELMYTLVNNLINRNQNELITNVILIDKYKIHRNHPWIKYWIPYNLVDNEFEASDLIVDFIIDKNLKERLENV